MSRLVSLILGASLGFAVTPVLAQSLITNGGFETGDFTGWNVSGIYTCVGTNQLCLGLGPYFDQDPGPHSGTDAAYFGGPTYQTDTLSQAITTLPGEGYYVSFWAAATSYQGAFGPNTITTEWNGNTVGLVSDVMNANYTEYTYWVSGTGADTLSFVIGNDPAGWVFDDISVTDAPEPASLAAFGTGLLALALVRRRRAT